MAETGNKAQAVNSISADYKGLKPNEALNLVATKLIEVATKMELVLQSSTKGEIRKQDLLKLMPAYMNQAKAAILQANHLLFLTDCHFYALAVIEETRHEAKIALKETPHLIPVFEPILDTIRNKFCANNAFNLETEIQRLIERIQEN